MSSFCYTKINNTLSKRDSKATVQITHPAHLLKGQVLVILPMVGGKLDANQVLVALPNGEQQLIPTEWTDLVDHPRSLLLNPAKTHSLTGIMSHR